MKLKGTYRSNLLTAFASEPKPGTAILFLHPRLKGRLRTNFSNLPDTANNEKGTPSACLSFWKVEK